MKWFRESISTLLLSAVLLLEAGLLCGVNFKALDYNLPIIPSPYFSLGDAVAALALVFAVYQLSDDSWALTMAIKGKFKRNLVWVLVIAGLFVTLVSALMKTPTHQVSNIANPLFWQLIAFLLFASAPFTLRQVGTNRKNLFGPKTAERFYHLILQSYSTGDSNKIKITTDIVNDNLPVMTEAIRSYLNEPPKGLLAPGRSIEENSRQDYRKYARMLLETTFSDAGIAAYIATQRIDFIWNYIGAIEDRGLYGSELGDSFRGIVSQLFGNRDSYLYRQKQFKGTGRYASVNNLVFGSKYLATAFAPIRIWSWFGVDDSVMYTVDYCEVFLSALELTMNTCNVFGDDRTGQDIALQLFELNEYTFNVIINDPTPGTYNAHYRIVSKILDFYKTTFLKAYDNALKNNDVSTFVMQSKKAERYKQSITAAYAEAFVDFLGKITAFQKDGMLTHTLVVFCLDNLFSKEDYANMRQTFIEYAWEAIHQSVDTGWYPAFIKIYIRIMYFVREKPAMPERDKLIKYFDTTLKSKFKSGAKMSNGKLMKDELLPSSIEYDINQNKFFWLDNSGARADFK